MPHELAVLGAINVDIVARTERAPGPGETVADGRLSRQPGGKGANQAAAAARLGARVTMLGAVGDDPDGAELTASLAALGIDTSGIQRVSDATGTAVIVVDATGENSIVVCPGANAGIDVADIVVRPGSAVLAQLEVPLTVVEHVFRVATGFRVLNAAPAVPLADWLIELADLVIVNETEYAQLPALREAPGAVAVTLGSRGAVLRRAGRIVAEAPGVRANVVNTVGAGDVFCAALTLALLNGDADDVALSRACAVGAAAVADERSQPRLARLETYTI